MPFAFDLLDQEQAKKAADAQQSQGASNAAPAFSGGGSTFGGGSGSGSAQPSQGKGTNTQGSGFVNLDKYMAANKGNQFGNQFTGQIQGSIDSAKQNLDKSASDFTSASNQGASKWNEVGDQAKSIVDNAGSGTSADDAKKFQSLENASYKGPESYTGSAYNQQAQGGLQKAYQQASAAQSEGGRFALLDQLYGRPTYSTGQKSLDNLLVQNTPGVGAKVQNLSNEAGLLSSKATQSQKDLDSLATANKFATQDTSNQAKKYLSDASNNFQTGLQKELADAQENQKSAYNNELSQFQNKSWSPENLRALGLSVDENTYGLDPTKYLTQASAPTINQVATPEEYARAQALAQLSSEGATPYLDQSLASQSGTNTSPYSFDRSGFESDAAKAKTDILTQLAALKPKLGGGYDPNTMRVNVPTQSQIDQWNELNQKLNETIGRQDPQDPYSYKGYSKPGTVSGTPTVSKKKVAL